MITPVLGRTSGRPPRAPGLHSKWRSHGRGRAMAGLLMATVASMVAWLPFLHAPLTADEAGFLLLAQHWSPGSSLYGDYWVDRPPLLMWLFSLASHGPTAGVTAGLTAPAIKILGATASGATVLLTGILTSLVAFRVRWSQRAAVVLAVALLSSPLLGMPVADGEVLAVPFVLLGLVCLMAAMRRDAGRSVLVLAAGAGGSAMAAALVKQNVIDVFVLAGVLSVLSRRHIPQLGAKITGFAIGAAATLGAALAGAAHQGTSPAGLWDAIVVFRLQATSVIGSSATQETPERLSRLILAFAASGTAAILLLSIFVGLSHVVQDRRRSEASTPDSPALLGTGLVWSALAMVAWELLGVLMGGSYWLHYLTGLVPGTVVLVAIVRPGHRTRQVLTACVAYTMAASAAVWVHYVSSPAPVSSEAEVMTYLRHHANASDGVVVAFGHPDIVAGSGLHSPYELQWSLPVRVRDPRLKEFQAVMTGRSAPRWIVVKGDNLDSWALDAAEAQKAQDYLEGHYDEQARYSDWHIWQRQEATAP